MNVLTSYPAKSNEAIAINIYDILGYAGPLAEHHGKKISELIAEALNSDKKVILSFKHLKELNWSFIKGAIAKLYESFPEEKIESSISLVDIPPEDVELIEEVVEAKKEFMKNPEKSKEPMSDEELEELREKEPSNPFFQIAGMFKDDPDFDDFLAEVEKYRRELDAEQEAYYSQFDEEE